MCISAQLQNTVCVYTAGNDCPYQFLSVSSPLLVKLQHSGREGEVEMQAHSVIHNTSLLLTDNITHA